MALSNLHSRTSTSPKVAAASITTLSLLLDVTLGTPDTDRGRNVVSIERNEATLNTSDAATTEAAAATLMAAIVNAGGKTAARVSTSNFLNKCEKDKIRPQSDVFSKEVNSRLPAPLNILLTLSTSSSNRSPTIRRAGIRIIRTVLLSTRLGWWKNNQQSESTDGNKDSDNDGAEWKDSRSHCGAGALERTALECCMRLLSGDNESVQSEARSTLALYQSYLGPSQWRERLSDSVCPRLLALIEELPALARRGQETECVNHMNLICGYLIMVIDTPNESNRDCVLDDIGIAAALTGPGGSEVIRRSIGGETVPRECPVILSNGHASL